MTAREARRKLGSRRTRKAARKILKNQRPMLAILRDKRAKQARSERGSKR